VLFRSVGNAKISRVYYCSSLHVPLCTMIPNLLLQRYENFTRRNKKKRCFPGMRKFSIKVDDSAPTDKVLSMMPSTSSSSSDTEKKEKPTFRILLKKYGVIAPTVYLGIYVTTLTSVYVALDLDVFNAATFGLDPAAAVTKFCDIVEFVTGNTEVPKYVKENPKVGTFAIAWVMTKITEPIRLAISLLVIPRVGRMLGKDDIK